jgi:NADP-dependent 3-hydroxy acid dehydrogenase YdfG
VYALFPFSFQKHIAAIALMGNLCYDAFKRRTPFMSATYTGKICVVTGAVSRIGRALCAELLRRGAVVYMGDVSDVALNAMTDEFNLAHPGRAFSVPTDVTQPLDAQRLADTAVSRKGKLDYLLMAGSASGCVPIDQVMAESWRYAVEGNLLGVINMVEAALPSMRAQGHGHIALTLPLTGLMPAPFESVNSAVHAAARALIESLRYELWDEKIQCAYACLDGVFAPDFELKEDTLAQSAAIAVLEGLKENVPAVIWPERARQEIEALVPATARREERLLSGARERKAGIRTKGAYI